MRHLREIAAGSLRIMGLCMTAVFLLAGCQYNLPQNMWKTYEPHGAGSADVPPRLSVVVMDFDEDDGAMELPSGGAMAGEQVYVGLQAGLDRPPRKFAKWLTEELSSTRYFQSVKYVESKEKLESIGRADLLVRGRLKKCYYREPSQILMMLLTAFPPYLGAMGLPFCCLGHEIEIEVNVSRFSEPENVLWQKNISVKDETKWVTIYMAAPAVQDKYQYYASRQKIMLKNAYLGLRDELAKEAQPGGRIFEGLRR